MRVKLLPLNLGGSSPRIYVHAAGKNTALENTAILLYRQPTHDFPGMAKVLQTRWASHQVEAPIYVSVHSQAGLPRILSP
jgi:hypothetical protein